MSERSSVLHWLLTSWSLSKGTVPLPQQESGTPLAAAMLGGVGDPGADEEGEDESGSEKEFEEPICALVQNCTMLHNIVGPACIFLRQGFAQSQIVRTHADRHAELLPVLTELHGETAVTVKEPICSRPLYINQCLHAILYYTAVTLQA